MPQVPNVPGVPSLSSYSANNIELLTADALLAAQFAVAAIFPTWGVYLNGAAIIQSPSLVSQTLGQILAPVQAVSSLINAFGGPSLVPNLIPVTASMVDFEYKQDWTVSDYPVENGGFQSYDKVQLPFDVKMRLAAGGTTVQRQAFLSTIDAMANGIDPSTGVPSLFDVLTPEKLYQSCCVSHYDFRRSAGRGVSLIVVDLWFIEVRVTSTQNYQNTQTPVIAGQQGTGLSTPTPTSLPPTSTFQ